ncbi:hypothetical protein ACNKXS_03385 [Christiangramia marina]|uniref:hypothetical protein n=1 Tax=Christiangramia marina TaxID=409436 RepID=UPI003AA963D1
MAATILITGNNPEEETKKTKALQYMANNLSMDQIEKLEKMARSPKARKMLDTNWTFLKMYT